ncbi:MAG: hypothetical protein AMXMBFR16_12360 [Candidatus Uhrbacteria bacterium]
MGGQRIEMSKAQRQKNRAPNPTSIQNNIVPTLLLNPPVLGSETEPAAAQLENDQLICCKIH